MCVCVCVCAGVGKIVRRVKQSLGENFWQHPEDILSPYTLGLVPWHLAAGVERAISPPLSQAPGL